MADKKRKTLQIKRPDPTKPSQKKVLPKVNMNDKAATSALDTDELTAVDPTTSNDRKSNTTRIALPDEEKIRKARRANVTQDLEQEGALPSADQIAQAQKNATMPIMIDTENVEESNRDPLKNSEKKDDMDRTMEIDADALSTANLSQELQKVDDDDQVDSDQTMRIDPEALQTGHIDKSLSDANNKDNTSDQTLKIDSSEGDDALTTGKNNQANDESLLSKETMQMDSIPDSELEDQPGTDLSVEEMKETFNAQTMAMDPKQLEEEMSSPESGDEEEDETLSKTMDLTKERPKTIMIKRPSKSPESGPANPTVKAVRPDAATVRTPRPVTATPGQAKQDTSRIDIPADGSTKEGKTIKLRRPSGGPVRSGSHMSRVAGNAGLTMNEDGSVSTTVRREEPLGAGWLAVAVITLLLSIGAIWSIMAISNPELPMPGRLVDANNQLIQNY